MASRHEARRQALDVLYQADVTGADPLEVLGEWRSAGRKVSRFARELVEGVAANLGELDGVIGEHAEGWTVPRLAAVDRTILRVGVYELHHVAETPPAVAIDEAVEAAKELSTEDSGRFVNGILGRIVREGAEP
ncbi:MAG TPA: transcription antitermination factor NusB [Actinomycetota bacterium]|nr:transcription antitermination factor NusB [Actinomycetota bacterium]